jgi:hypothetical protein
MSSDKIITLRERREALRKADSSAEEFYSKGDR